MLLGFVLGILTEVMFHSKYFSMMSRGVRNVYHKVYKEILAIYSVELEGHWV